MTQCVYAISGESRHLLEIQEQSRVGQGGAGKIYLLNDAQYPETVAKIFHQADQCERAKIQAMLDAHLNVHDSPAKPWDQMRVNEWQDQIS